MNKREDLVFHVVSKRKFREQFQAGRYNPPEAETEGLRCVDVHQLKEHLDRDFRSRKNLLILVIDKIRLESRISLHEEDGTYHISGGINQDAVIDKIRIDCTIEGTFDVSVESV